MAGNAESQKTSCRQEMPGRQSGTVPDLSRSLRKAMTCNVLPSPFHRPAVPRIHYPARRTASGNRLSGNCASLLSDRMEAHGCTEELSCMRWINAWKEHLVQAHILLFHLPILPDTVPDKSEHCNRSSGNLGRRQG
jgi:hypothetical protein